MDFSEKEYEPFYYTGQDINYGATQLSDLSLLIQATCNEKNSPEILGFQEDLVTRVEQKLQKHQSMTEELDKDIEQELRRMVLSLEVRRVSYLLKLYYKARLKKIEKYAASLLDNEDLFKRLSANEQTFCHNYFIVTGSCLKEAVLNHLPKDFQNLVRLSDSSEIDDLIPYPPMDAHVFCKIAEDVGLVTLPGGEEDDQVVEMKKDDVFIIRYEPVAGLVRENQATLI